METRRHKSGLYIVIEGPDGGGSSTQIEEAITPHFGDLGFELGARTINGTNKGKNFVLTREPGGTKEGEAIRYDLLHDEEVDNTPQEEFAKFNRQRIWLGRLVLTPSLNKKKLVIAERNHRSSYSYQGFGWKLDKEMIREVSRQTLGPRLFTPDATVVLMVPPEVTYERLLSRTGTNPDKIERRNLKYFQRVYNGYEAGVEIDGGELIDATQEKRKVGDAVVKSIYDQVGEERILDLLAA